MSRNCQPREGGSSGVPYLEPRKRLENPGVSNGKNEVRGKVVLRESFALPLQQTVACFGSLELSLHQPERLPRREDRLAILGQ